MNFIQYAIQYNIVEKEEDIPLFRYGCHVGLKAIEKLFEHKNQQYYPRILPRRSSPERTVLGSSTETMGANLLQSIENHKCDGVRVEELVKDKVKSLGEQVTVFQEIADLSSRKRCLDQQMEYTLPAYTEKPVTISSAELVEIHLNLPEVTPLRRADIEDTLVVVFKAKNYDVDEVISGLVQYSFI